MHLPSNPERGRRKAKIERQKAFPLKSEEYTKAGLVVVTFWQSPNQQDLVKTDFSWPRN